VAVGPSVANEDAFAMRRLAGLLGARLCTADLSGAPTARLAMRAILGRGYGIPSLDTIAGADLIWVVGADLDECPQVGSRVVEARRGGGAVVRFDVHASGGDDGARVVMMPPDRFGRLPLSLQKAVFDADLAAAAARAAAGYERLAHHWRSVPPLGGPVGVADEEVLVLAREFRAARRPVVIIGSRWLTSARAEDDTLQLLQALALLGAADRLFSAVGDSNSWGCLDVLGPELPPAELACREDGLDTLFVVADDLVRRSPRPDTLADTLDHLRTVVVIDRFVSDTLPFADVVLPSCAFAETDGTTTNAFGAVQRCRRAVSPPADCCPERVWAARIGRRFGAEAWPDTPRSWFDALRDEVDGYRGLSSDSLYGDESVQGSTTPDSDAAPRVDVQTRLAFARPVDEGPFPEDAADASFPMRLVLGSHPANWSTGALSQREDLLRREVLESTVAAAPAVLKELGVKPGWPAKVLVPAGEATVTVRADPHLPPGVLVLVPLAGSPSVRLRGCYAGPGRRSVGVQPVPARLERV
jgi:predicted molibdopterin-dependent oxidoreductase YjgC